MESGRGADILGLISVVNESVRVCVCVCVCERERERETDRQAVAERGMTCLDIQE